MPKLTKRVVDALKPDPHGEVFAWDSELKGFGVRIMSSGVASYILKYRNQEGRQRKLKIGRVGAITPEQARDLAIARSAEATSGTDPSADRHRLRKSITVAELCDLFIEDSKSRVKPTTFSNNKSHLNRHVKPLIGSRTVLSVTHADVAKLQADIVSGKSARPREGRGGVTTGGYGVASRTISVFGAVLEYAKRRKIVTENVMRGLARPPDRKQRRFLSLAEIQRLGVAMREAEANDESATGISATKFLLLTGCRRMEVLALPSSWVDKAARCIRFGDTKSGAQIRPIGERAFEALPQGNTWAFPAERGDGHFVGLPKVLARLCERAGLKGVTVHVLRHSFAATAAELGFSELTIAGLLGHSVPGVTARYAHVPDSALVIAADRVSARISAALAGQADEGKIVQPPKRRKV